MLGGKFLDYLRFVLEKPLAGILFSVLATAAILYGLTHFPYGTL